MYNIDGKDYQRIIIEGPDGAGKSTLANMLESHFEPTAYCHWTSPPRPYTTQSHFQYLRKIYNIYKQIGKITKNHLIYDRCVASEIVYGPIYRSIDSSNMSITVEKEMAELGWKQIYVTAPLDALKERLSYRGDWLVDETKIATIKAGYDEHMLNKTGLPTFVYYTDLPYTESLEQEERLIKWLEQDQNTN